MVVDARGESRGQSILKFSRPYVGWNQWENGVVGWKHGGCWVVDARGESRGQSIQKFFLHRIGCRMVVVGCKNGVFSYVDNRGSKYQKIFLHRSSPKRQEDGVACSRMVVVGCKNGVFSYVDNRGSKNQKFFLYRIGCRMVVVGENPELLRTAFKLSV